jgi:tripartite-type tricarboxylate transporter receptor subunit TctC
MRFLAFSIGMALAASVFAQAFPARAVRFVVPFPPGGATDIIARVLAQKMGEAWGVAVVVENRAGAAGAIGSDAVAKAAPDGHTILMGTTSTHAVNPAINPKLPYNNVTDFAAVTLVATFPNVLVAHPSTANSLQELIATLKMNPGKYNFGSSGAGSSTHLTGELFKLMTQTDINHIPYKGTGPLLNDLMAGHVAFAFDQITGVMPFVASGRLRALGVTSLGRNPALPDVPAVAEALPGFEAMAWVGVFAPAKTPGALTGKMQTEIRRILALPDVAQRMKEFGATPVGDTPAQFADFVAKDTGKWRSLVSSAKIKIER